MLKQAVTQLSDHWRTAFVLRDIVGSSTTDAARVVGAHQAAFKSCLHRGRMQLRTLSEPDVDVDPV